MGRTALLKIDREAGNEKLLLSSQVCKIHARGPKENECSLPVCFGHLTRGATNLNPGSQDGGYSRQ